LIGRVDRGLLVGAVLLGALAVAPPARAQDPRAEALVDRVIRFNAGLADAPFRGP
jgi:hypothetical protein